MWELLRNRKLADLKFRRQHQIGDYIVDFFCAEHGLVVELDGSAHQTAERKKHDARRDNYLRSLGHTVIRFPNHRVFDDIEKLFFEILSSIPALSGPSPSGRGQGEGKQNRADTVLFIDARHIYRQVDRAHRDWPQSQIGFLANLVRLYRGERDEVSQALLAIRANAVSLAELLVQAILPSWSEAGGGQLAKVAEALHKWLELHAKDHTDAEALATAKDEFHAWRKDEDAFATRAGEWVQIITAYRVSSNDSAEKGPPESIASRVAVTAEQLLLHRDKLQTFAGELVEWMSLFRAQWSRAAEKLGARKQFCERRLDDANKHLSRALADIQRLLPSLWENLELSRRYTDCFPTLHYRDVPGLCKAATLKEIEAQGWSLNPGRYVGVAPGEEVSDEDFKAQLQALNEELETLNAKARTLEQTIAKNTAEILEA